MMSDSSNAAGTSKIARGGLYLTLTKLWFILGSYVIYFGMTRVSSAGDAILGDYKLAGAWLSILGTVLVQGTTQAVSRFVSADPASTRALRRRALGFQLILGGVLSTAYFLAAPTIAGVDAHLIEPLRVSAAIPFLYSLYAVVLGVLNGRKAYGLQAAVDGTFTTTKLAFVLVGTAIFGTAAGAYAGFALAALVILLIAAFASQRTIGPAESLGSGPSVGNFVAYQFQTVGFMLVVQWIVQMDLQYFQWTVEGGQAVRDSGRTLYAAVQLFAQIPYSLVVAVTLVMFPLVSASAAEGGAQAQRYIREAVRWALMIVILATTVICARAEFSLPLLLSDYPKLLAGHEAAPLALATLGVGYVALALYFLLGSALNAAGSASTAVLIGLVMAGVQWGLCFALTPSMGILGPALASAAAMMLGAVVALVVLGRRFGSVLPIKTALRCVLAAGVGVAVARGLPAGGKLMTLVQFAATGMVAILVLVLSGEFSREDRQRILGMLGRGRR
jgi:O-antigen/teichoic acid export membrane protein